MFSYWYHLSNKLQKQEYSATQLLELIPTIKKNLESIKDEGLKKELIAKLDEQTLKLSEQLQIPNNEKDIDFLLSIELSQITIAAATAERVLQDQSFFIEKMAQLGYIVNEEGMCFGMSHMAMQAFLAKDIETFEQRLNYINNNLKSVDIADDFKNLRTVDGKLTEEIIGVKAFFDGIALYAQTKEYAYERNAINSSIQESSGLFESPKDIMTQDAKEVMPITTPLNLSDNPPICINSSYNMFTKGEMAQYFEFLQTQMGNDSFALTLGGNKHRVSLNYDSQNKTWIFFDPNYLPGLEIKDTDILESVLYESFSIESSDNSPFLMETTFFTKQNNVTDMQNLVSKMQSQEVWQSLHSSEKLKLVDTRGESLAERALNKHDIDWFKKNIDLIDINLLTSVKHSLLYHALILNSKNTGEIAKLLVKSGAKFYSNDMAQAIRINNIDIVKLFLQNGYQLTEKDMISALSYNNIEIVRLFIQQDYQPTNICLEFALNMDNLDCAEELIKFGIISEDSKLNKLINSKAQQIVSQQGINVSPVDFNKMMLSNKEEDIRLVRLLLAAGKKPVKSYINNNQDKICKEVKILLNHYGLTPENEPQKSFSSSPPQKSTENHLKKSNQEFKTRLEEYKHPNHKLSHREKDVSKESIDQQPISPK